MIKPIVFDLKNIPENGFGCYLKGRSYDLQENNENYNPKLAVKYYKKGYYDYQDVLCQYSIAISNYLGDFKELFDEKDKKVVFPSIDNIKSLNKSPNDIQRIYAKFVLAAYYNYGLAGIQKNEDKAFEIILECAQNGHVGAMYDLGAKDKFKSKIDNSKMYLELASQNGSKRAKKLIDN